ncbi:hypothetical protein [Neptuniibacter sp. QD37_11]|uniref:hypothetical protein n=1 Tax=Neptuniibacter sp. QD37_11 TaxID=3398209 RepID=UPI0039F48639
MQNIQREQAEYILPVGMVKQVHESLAEVYNEHLNILFKEACAALIAVKEQHDGKAGVNWPELCMRELWQTFGNKEDASKAYDLISSGIPPFGNMPHNCIQEAVVPTNIDCHLEDSSQNHIHIMFEGIVIMSSASDRKISWAIAEGPLAVEQAYRNPVLAFLLSSVESIKWTADSGGRIWGTDTPPDAKLREYEATFGVYDRPTEKKAPSFLSKIGKALGMGTPA